MLIIALVLALVGLVALVFAVVTSNELVAWVCIGASVLGVVLLIIDAVRERQRGEPASQAMTTSGGRRGRRRLRRLPGGSPRSGRPEAGAGVSKRRRKRAPPQPRNRRCPQRAAATSRPSRSTQSFAACARSPG